MVWLVTLELAGQSASATVRPSAGNRPAHYSSALSLRMKKKKGEKNRIEASTRVFMQNQ